MNSSFPGMLTIGSRAWQEVVVLGVSLTDDVARFVLAAIGRHNCSPSSESSLFSLLKKEDQ
eukprot:1441755-Ditylum_brightwellii.AAC.1